MSQDYSPSLVTKNLVFCGDAAMKSAAGPATLLYDKVNDNNGTMYNGTCLDFDGTDDYVTIPHNLILDNENALTIECWINTSFDAAFPGEIGVIRKGSGSASGWSNAGWSIRLRDDIPAIAFRKKDDTGYWDLYTGDKIIDGNWHHIVGTFDTTTLRKYVDGVQTQSTSTGQAYLTTTENLEIGRISAYLDGNISNVRLYNVALSAANVKELYDDSKVIIPTKNDASGGFVAQTNLKGWWPLVDGAGDYAYDGSGNGNDGTLTNMTSADWLTGQTGAPQLVEGYNRKAVFEDSTDYVLADNAGITGDLSVSAWIYRFSDTLYYAGVVAKMGPSSGGDGWMFRFDSSHHLEFMLQRSGSYSGEATATLSNNAWHHVVGTNDGTNLKVYVDGSLATTVSSGGATTDSGTKIQIGTYGYAGSNPPPNSYPFYGIVDEVIIYNSALTLAQVQVLAATGPNGGPLPPDPMSLSNSSDINGYWRNDGNVTWADRSSGSNTATVYGSPATLLFKQGINGQKNVNTGRDNQGFPLKFKNVGAVGFNGVDDYIAVADSPYLDGFTQFSISANLYPAKLGQGGIIKKWATVGQKSFMLYYESDGQLDLAVSSDGTNTEYQESIGGMTEGVWNDIAVTFDAGEFKAYINGVDVGVDANFSTQLSVFAGSDPINIGYANWADYYHEGQLGNVRLYNRALTNTEIKQNFAAQASRFQIPRSIVTDGLVLWLEAGDGSYPGSGTTWYDLSGNGYDATLVGGPTVTSRGVELNGSTQYITLAHGGNLSFSSGDFTISVWCNYNGGTGYGGIITNDYSSDNAWKIFKDNSQAYFKARSGSTIVSFPAYTLNTFHCYTYTRTGSLLQVYFDGVASYTASSPASPTSYNDIAFGSYRYADAVNLAYLNNQTIGTTTLYNRALSAGEVAQNFRVQRERFGV